MSILASKADITFVGQGTQSATVTATLTDPDTVTTGTGSQSSNAGTSETPATQFATASTEGDSATASTVFNTTFTSLTGESFSYVGGPIISAQLTSQSSYSASVDTKDITTITFIPDEALTLTGTLGGSFPASANPGISSYVSLFDTTISTSVFDRTTSGTSTATLTANDTYILTAEGESQFSTSGNSPEAPVSYTGNGNFTFNFEASAAPEPSTYAMLLGGLGLLVIVIRLRTKLAV